MSAVGAVHAVPAGFDKDRRVAVVMKLDIAVDVVDALLHRAVIAIGVDIVVGERLHRLEISERRPTLDDG